MADYPQHEKIKALNGANQVVGDFIEWLGEQGYELARHHATRDELVPVMRGRNDLIAAFFEIDTQALEAETLSMLAAFTSRTQA